MWCVRDACVEMGGADVKVLVRGDGVVGTRWLDGGLTGLAADALKRGRRCSKQGGQVHHFGIRLVSHVAGGSRSLPRDRACGSLGRGRVLLLLSAWCAALSWKM